MKNNRNNREEYSGLKLENSLLSKDEQLSIQLNDNLANYQPSNQQQIEFIPELEQLENHQLPGDNISTERDKKGLSQLNKNLAALAKQLAHQPELNGLLLSGLLLDSLTQIAEPFLEPKLDKQAAGVAVINRLREIVPDRFVGESQQPFCWRDPNLGQTYQFEIEGGDLIREQGKTKLTPKHLKVRKLHSRQTIFQASSLDHKSWQVQQCDFSSAQLRSLVHGENLLPKPRQKQQKLSREKPSLNSNYLTKPEIELW